MAPTKYLAGTTLATNGITRSNRKGRPNYPIDFKRQLAARACEPGISVARLALEHGINANMLFKWRRHYRAELFDGPGSKPVAAPMPPANEIPKLLPVVAEPPTARQDPDGVKPAAMLEIVMSGATVRVIGKVSRSALRAVLDCLAERT